MPACPLSLHIPARRGYVRLPASVRHTRGRLPVEYQNRPGNHLSKKPFGIQDSTDGEATDLHRGYSCLKGSTWRQLANPNAIGEEGIPTLDCTICGDPISPFVICVPDAYTGGTEVVVWRGEDGNCDTCCDENGMSLPTEATTWICDDYGCVEEFPDNKIIAGHNYVLDSCEN